MNKNNFELDTLSLVINRLEAYYYKRKGQAEELKRQKNEALKKRDEILKRIGILQQVKLLFQHSSVYAREQARQQIQQMVTQALQYTFGPDISFEVELLERRGQPDAEFYVVSNYDGTVVRTSPLDARGGGVVDVVSMALRIALLETSLPPLKGPLILDEPGKHVSQEFAPNLARLLKSLSDAFGRQVLMVTHNRHFAENADRVYVVDLVDGISCVRPLE